MATVKQQAKSKTNQAMVVGGAILSILPAFGVEVPQEVAVGGMALLGVIMRQFTSTSVKDK